MLAAEVGGGRRRPISSFISVDLRSLAVPSLQDHHPATSSVSAPIPFICVFCVAADPFSLHTHPSCAKRNRSGRLPASGTAPVFAIPLLTFACQRRTW